MAKATLMLPEAPTAAPFTLADLLAGDAIVTLVAKHNGERYTYRTMRFDYRDNLGNASGQNGYAVRLLRGPDNTRDYAYMGMLDAKTGILRQTKASKISTEAHSWLLFAWFARNLAEGRDVQGKCDIYLAGRCLRCGRILTVPDSIEARYGPDCAEKLLG